MTITPRTRTTTLVLIFVLFAGYYLIQHVDSLAALGRRPAIQPIPPVMDNSATLLSTQLPPLGPIRSSRA